MPKKTRIPVPLKLYNTLKNHASEISQTLGCEVTVDEFVDACLRYGLDNRTILEDAIKKARKNQN